MSGIMEDDAFVRLFQKKAGLEVDGWAGPDTIAALDKLFAGSRAAQEDDLPEDYFPLLAKIESGGRPYVKAKTSSASGLYQFIKSTWEGEGGSWGQYMGLAFGGFKPSEEEQLMRARSFTAKNAEYLQEGGVRVNKASLYAAHFLGAVTARRVLDADVNDRVDHLAGEGATKANESILRGKTVGEFYSWLHRKTGDWVR